MSKQKIRGQSKGDVAKVFEQIRELTTQNTLLSTEQLAEKLQNNRRLGQDVEVTPFLLSGMIDALEASGHIGAAVKHVTEGGDRDIMVFYDLKQGRRLEAEGIVSKLYDVPPAEVVAEQRWLLSREKSGFPVSSINWMDISRKER